MSRTLSLSTAAFPGNIFRPVKLSGVERVNELFCYQLILKTPDLDRFDFKKQLSSSAPSPNIDISSWLGQSVTAGIELRAGTRYISGIISNARYLYHQRESAYYSIELRPFLYNATLKSDYKIFQDLNVIEILDQVLSAYPGTVEKRLYQNQQERYPTRIYQTQFGETDFQFFTRLASEFGINCHFEHNESGHTLVLSDSESDHKPIPHSGYQQIDYYPPNHDQAASIRVEHLHEFNLTAQVVSGAFASADYDYGQASVTIRNEQNNIQPYPEARQKGAASNGKEETEKEKNAPAEIAQRQHEIYEYAADVVQPKVESADTETPYVQGGGYNEEHTLRNQYHLERLQQGHFTASAAGHIRGIACGHRFLLNKHPNSLANINWTVTSTELLILDVIEESQRKEDNQSSLLAASSGENTLSSQLLDNASKQLNKLSGTEEQWQIDCRSELIPANIPIRPDKIDKPKACLQNALVVGGGGVDALYVDPLGRIKVQFYWDRYGQRNENSSCWVRVNQPWAGNQMGAVFTPRVGEEVLIDYINNDPDLPVCMGKVNNSNNMPNWALTESKALSGFRSREMPQGNSASGRSNHLVFDDSSGNIQTQLKSDHAHSQLSLGDITRIEDNAGRKDGRGQGFELRTDDWGVNRAAKGLYFTTYGRDGAVSTTMDAVEAQQLLEEARQLVKQLSKLAVTHEAEPLSGTEPLKAFAKVVTTEDAQQAAAAQKPQQAGNAQPKGFAENILVGAGEAGIALVTPKDTHQYSAQKHTITAGQDLNITTGQSWLASIQNKMSFFVQQGVKIFSGKGKIQIQANRNNVEMIADKTLKVISANDKIEVIAKKEILITCGGAYIRLKDGNIEIHAPGTVEQKAAVHPFMGPTSLAKEMPRLPTSELKIAERFSIHDHLFGRRSANQPYRVTLEDGTVYEGVSNQYGETEVIKSHIPQKAYIALLNQNKEIINVTEKTMLWNEEDMPQEYVAHTTEESKTNEIQIGDETRHHNIETGNRNDSNEARLGPYAFGIKFPNFAGTPPKLKGYSVIKQYYESLIAELRTLDWEALFPPLVENKAKLKAGQITYDEVGVLMEQYYTTNFKTKFDSLIIVFENAMKLALTHPDISNLALPTDMTMPELKFANLGDVHGTASSRDWEIQLNHNLLTLLAYEFIVEGLTTPTNFRMVQDGNSVFKRHTEGGFWVISALLHETRHMQQHFWCHVYMTEFQANMKISIQNPDSDCRGKTPDFAFYSNYVSATLRTYCKNNKSKLVKVLKDNSYVYEALEQMSIVFLLVKLEFNVYKRPNNQEIKNKLKLIQALTKERFEQFIGKDNQPIAYQYFTYKDTESGNYKEQDYGYYILPYENDARITQDILKYEFAISKEGLAKSPEKAGVPLPAVSGKYSVDYPSVPAGSGSGNTAPTGGN